MKLGLLGDVHARVRAPAGRQDDWFNVQLGKFRAALDWFEGQGCKYILQPGDMFDAPKPANIVLSTYISELRQRDLTLLAVLGQHDTYYHDVVNAERTALHILQSAGVAYLLGDKLFKCNGVQIYGASWGQEPLILRRRGGSAVNILVAHAPVGDHPLWPGHKPIQPARFAKKHPGFDLICLGDYHYRFMVDSGSTRLVNVGCLMRMRNTPQDHRHEPGVGVYDTETQVIEFYMLPIEPSVVVFAPSVEGRSEPSVPLREFLDRLKRTGKLGTSFLDNLELITQDTGSDVRQVVDEILEAVGVKE